VVELYQKKKYALLNQRADDEKDNCKVEKLQQQAEATIIDMHCHTAGAA
jgi:hypothetical protein